MMAAGGNNTREPVTVLLCVDDGYIAQASVAIGSMLMASRSRFNVIIAAINRDDALWRRYLSPLEARFDTCRIEIVDVDAEVFSSLPTTGAITLSTYSRILLAQIMADRGDRVIYLDADILVLGDLAELWRMSLKGIAAAAPDPFNINAAEIGFTRDEFYFNAGIMLIDVAIWRVADIGSRALQYLVDNPDTPWLDQDALNVTLRGRTMPLPMEWNFQPRCADVTPAFLSMNADDYRRTRRAPKIIHFTTSHKPWNDAWRVHYSELYFAAVKTLGLEGAFVRPRPATRRDHILSWKTRLRWHLPTAFRLVRLILRPELARRAYSVGPDARVRPPRTI